MTTTDRIHDDRDDNVRELLLELHDCFRRLQGETPCTTDVTPIVRRFDAAFLEAMTYTSAYERRGETIETDDTPRNTDDRVVAAMRERRPAIMNLSERADDEEPIDPHAEAAQ